MSKVHTIKSLSLLLLLLLSHVVSIAQNTSEFRTKANTSIPNIEKVYLHTDRSNYIFGENLWYKAYMVYAYTNTLYDSSKLLYVELISPDSKILARNITKLEAGLGHGDFKLTDSIGIEKPGKYQIRAYTNWMRNFGDDFIFIKEIEIIDVNEQTTESTKESAKNLKTPTVQATDISIQFFPEGGSLIEGVTSVVAFKATDAHGYPLYVKGQVFDTKGNLITSLESKHDGMGAFVLTPIKEEQYTVKIRSINESQLTATVPKAQKQGYVLSVSNYKGKKLITIKTNKETLKENSKESLIFIASAKGITYFEGTQALAEEKTSFLLPEEDFPEGIAQMTLYDESMKPHSERLLYIEKEKDIDVTLTTNKEQYVPKEKVNIKVSAKTTQGTPVLASFSLASIEENKINGIANSNICSYFLMESDIKGAVHNPGHYFDIENTRRLKDLDLLLLTQGWRDFLWKQLPEFKGEKRYNIEHTLNVSGRVKEGLGNAVKNTFNISMVLTNKEKMLMKNTTTNSNGGFKFEDISFLGEASLLLNTQNKKGKNKGELFLYSMYRDPIPADYKEKTSAPSTEKDIAEFKANALKKSILFNVPYENMLDEVVITGKKNERKERTAIGSADYVRIIDEKTPYFSSITRLIQFSIPGIFVSGNSLRFSRYQGSPLILLDGAEMDISSLEGVATDDVDRIESITSAGAAVYGSRGGNGVILIYTKEGTVNGRLKKVKHSISKKIQGYYDARIFYSPNYDNPESIENKDADIRNTLYWNPYVHPDENGNVELSYFNSEVSTEINVTLEGITEKGIPIVVKSNYNVEKQE